MKVVLKYNLPKEKDDFTLALKGSEYYCSLNDIFNCIRSKIKYQDLSKEVEEILEEIRELIPDLDDVS